MVLNVFRISAKSHARSRTRCAASALLTPCATIGVGGRTACRSLAALPVAGIPAHDAATHNPVAASQGATRRHLADSCRCEPARDVIAGARRG